MRLPGRPDRPAGYGRAAGRPATTGMDRPQSEARSHMPMGVCSRLVYAGDLDVRRLVREVLAEGGQGAGICAVVASRPVRMWLSSAAN